MIYLVFGDINNILTFLKKKKNTIKYNWFDLVLEAPKVRCRVSAPGVVGIVTLVWSMLYVVSRFYPLIPIKEKYCSHNQTCIYVEYDKFKCFLQKYTHKVPNLQKKPKDFCVQVGGLFSPYFPTHIVMTRVRGTHTVQQRTIRYSTVVHYY